MSGSDLSILLTGAAGYVGSYIQPMLSAIGRRRVDVLDADITAPDLEVPDVDVVIHLAGRLNSFAGAESEIERINHEGTVNLARRCRRGTHFVFLSTDQVFASDPERIYAESDTVAPETAYGRSKAAAEAFLLANMERVTILRTSVLYGYSHPRRRNTVEFIESKLRAGETIDLFSDVFTCPTYIGDLAACIERAVGEGVYGTHHACGAEFVSRCDIAEALCESRGYSRELIRPVPRPASSNIPRFIHMRQSPAMSDLLTVRLADYLELGATVPPQAAAAASP
jgi:dTDP-4-dehydrorhamnose reductase